MEFTNLRMENMTINEYYNKFIELMRSAPEVVPTEAIKAQKFEQGLTLNLQGKLGGVSFEILDEVYGRVAHLHNIKGREMDSFGKKKKSVEAFHGGGKKRGPNENFRGKFEKGDSNQSSDNAKGNRNQGREEKRRMIYFCKRCEKNHPE